MTLDEAIEAASHIWQWPDLCQVLQDAKITAETLTRCQSECTRLLEENREQRRLAAMSMCFKCKQHMAVKNSLRAGLLCAICEE